MPSGLPEDRSVEDVGVVGIVDIGAEEGAVSNSSRVQAPLHPPPLLVIGVPSTQIFRLVSGKGAPCTINSENKVTSVQSQQRARGKMYSPQDLTTNETGTSPLTSVQ